MSGRPTTVKSQSGATGRTAAAAKTFGEKRNANSWISAPKYVSSTNKQ